MNLMNVDVIRSRLAILSSPEKQKVFLRFFKTGKGEYGEGDQFLGITVPNVRKVAKEYFAKVSIDECTQLLKSKIHEERLCALIMLVYQFEKTTTHKTLTTSRPHTQSPSDSTHLSSSDLIRGSQIRNAIFRSYLANTKHVNNWDLVDVSCYKIVGQHLVDLGDWSILKKLAESKSLWERRIAMVSTFAFLQDKNPMPTLSIANILLRDKHDLIHKGVGWMLREMGKRVGEKHLTDFLDKNATKMPRTALRYAIERLSEKQRKYYLKFTT